MMKMSRDLTSTIMYIPGWMRCHDGNGVAMRTIANTYRGAQCVYHDWDGNRCWHTALRNADAEAMRLAEEIILLSSAKQKATIIIGHSLGARIVARVLSRIATCGVKVTQGVLLGAAIPVNDSDVQRMRFGAELPIVNFVNENDVMLKCFYAALGGEDGKALGIFESSEVPRGVLTYVVSRRTIIDTRIDALWSKFKILRLMASHYAPFYLAALEKEVAAANQGLGVLKRLMVQRV